MYKWLLLITAVLAALLLVGCLGNADTQAPGQPVGRGGSAQQGQPSASETQQSGAGGEQAAAAANDAAVKLVTAEYSVTGMTCDDCSSAIESELIKVPGVSTVSADWKTGSTKVQYDAGKVTDAQLIAAIEKLGYTAKLAAGA